jgi:hypothetical protein
MQAATAEWHISCLHASPLGEAKAKVAAKPGASTNATNIQSIAFTGTYLQDVDGMVANSARCCNREKP